LSDTTVADLLNFILLMMGADAPILLITRESRRPGGRVGEFLWILLPSHSRRIQHPTAASITLLFNSPEDFIYENR
jgi:hypothetical protein